MNIKTHEINGESNQKEDEWGLRILFLTALTIDFSRFELNFSCYLWALRRGSISGLVWYRSRSILRYAYNFCSVHLNATVVDVPQDIGAKSAGASRNAARFEGRLVHTHRKNNILAIIATLNCVLTSCGPENQGTRKKWPCRVRLFFPFFRDMGRRPDSRCAKQGVGHVARPCFCS